MRRRIRPGHLAAAVAMAAGQLPPGAVARAPGQVDARRLENADRESGRWLTTGRDPTVEALHGYLVDRAREAFLHQTGSAPWTAR